MINETVRRALGLGRNEAFVTPLDKDLHQGTA